MSKAPAFQFYFDRFNSSTALWDDCQVGKYIRLMICQANKGFVSEKELRKVAENDQDVLSKFKEIGPGQFANEVLSGILSDRDAYRESRQQNRLKGLKKKEEQTHDKHMNNICSTQEEHMVDVDVVVDVDKGKGVKEKGVTGEKTKPTDLIPDDWPKEKFTELWREFVEMRNKKKKPLTGNAVKRRIAQLVAVSGGSYDEAEKIALRSIDKAYDEFFAPSDNGSGAKVFQVAREKQEEDYRKPFGKL